MIALTIKLRDEDPVEPTTVDYIDHPTNCNHTDTICASCVESWAMDWDLVSCIIITGEGSTAVPFEGWPDTGPKGQQ